MIRASETSLPDLALRILERVKPELHQAIQRRRALELLLEQNPDKVVEVDPKRLHIDGIIHRETFSPGMFNVIRLVREALLDVFPQSWHDTVDSFRMDMEAENELFLRLYIASVSLAILNEGATGFAG